ncbi:microfibrillar-associated protein 2 isoform X3 [Saccopteryx leptura]|uniref:microfibrillar-associated protein 2 isoform X3 n=1 Tax=Saccopteryx leptura TaxID=249018 RepID=UPI00339C9924
MRAAYLFLLFLPAGLLAQGQYDLDPLPPFPDHVQYTHYGDQIDNPDYYDYQEATPRPSEEQFQFQSQQQVQQEVIPAPTFEPGNAETEPTEPGPLVLVPKPQPPSLIPPVTQTAVRSSTRAPASTPYTSPANSVSTRSASTASVECTSSIRRSVSARSVPTRSSSELTYVGTSSPNVV